MDPATIIAGISAVSGLINAAKPQQDPLINLAYNYNMENSPF